MKELSDLLDTILGPAGALHQDHSMGRQWQRLDEAGLLRLGIPEAVGGVGGTLADAALVIERGAAAGVSGPTVETLLIAATAAHRAGWSLPPGIVTAALAAGSVMVRTRGSSLRVRAQLTEVAWADAADSLVLVVPEERAVILFERGDYEARRGHNLAGEARDAVMIHATVPADHATAGIDTSDFELLAALGRTLQLLGAQQACLELTTAHVRQRVQFGQPLAAQQAVRHLVADLAEEVAATRAVTQAAVDRVAVPPDARVAQIDDRAAIAIAAARVQAARAATTVAAAAHQLHGAIGISHEHPLHHFTSRLWSWRDEYGTEREWAERLASSVCGRPDLWRTLTELSDPHIA